MNRRELLKAALAGAATLPLVGGVAHSIVKPSVTETTEVLCIDEAVRLKQFLESLPHGWQVEVLPDLKHHDVLRVYCLKEGYLVTHLVFRDIVDDEPKLLAIQASIEQAFRRGGVR